MVCRLTKVRWLTTIVIFKLKSGVSYNPGDPNYDLFKLAMRVSAKRLFPNFESIDAPYNLMYYDPTDPRTEIATMGCRTRTIGNHFDPSNQVVAGRGNFSFTTINLPRLALEANGNHTKFFRELDKTMDLCRDQLLWRFELISKKHVYNFPFLMGQHLWTGSEKLKQDDEIGDVLKQASISIGFCGLAECLVALVNKHHGESAEAQELGLRIIGHMHDMTERYASETNLNFTLFATPRMLGTYRANGRVKSW